MQAFFGHVSTLGCLSVRTKTFSTHVVLKKRLVVSKSGLFTHERHAFSGLFQDRHVRIS